jgi:hypothetical protein
MQWYNLIEGKMRKITKLYFKKSSILKGKIEKKKDIKK